MPERKPTPVQRKTEQTKTMTFQTGFTRFTEFLRVLCALRNELAFIKGIIEKLLPPKDVL